MSRRLVIGTTIISTDPAETVFAGVAPVNASVRLYQHPLDKDFYSYLFDNVGNAEVKCRILIEGTTAATANTAWTTLLPILKAVRNKTVKFEYVSGSQRYALPSEFGEQFNLEAQLVASGSGYRLDCRFVSTGFGPPDEGSPNGAITPLLWTLTFRAGGLAVARGSVTFGTLSARNTWVNLLKGGTHPTWMSNKFKFFGGEDDFADKSTGWSGNQQYTVTVEMRQQIGALASNPAMSPLRDFAFNAVRHDRAPNSAGYPGRRGTTRPGKDVSISGHLQFKTEALSSFNGSDSVTTAHGGVYAAADRALDAILQHVSSMIPYDTVELDRRVDFDATEGYANFTVGLGAPRAGKEFVYLEKCTLRFESGLIFGTRSDGTTKAWQSVEGMPVYLDHDVTVRSLVQPQYQTPLVAVPSQWASLGGELNDPVPERELHESGAVMWNLRVKTSWKRMNNSESDALPPPAMNQNIAFTNMQ
ncbi:MAG: hypothetical protein IT464_12725 [Planctomycetes bacterium]|nr:hypothetical protein [Planctomycetota bacterium]